MRTRSLSLDQLEGEDKMRKPRTTFAIIAVAAAALGGVTVAATAGGSTPTHPAAATSLVKGTGPATLDLTAPTTLHSTLAEVGGVKQIILVDAKGLPLYTYRPDTATQSLVTGQLAALWPALVSNAPTSNGLTGTVAVVTTGNGHQVSYNGHFLYTFIQDSPGHVTGQGVQNFFVATPAIGPNPAASTSGSTAPAPANNGYGY
jgi:predicted lipoprotein with Yx(FWY)xxD motif